MNKKRVVLVAVITCGFFSHYKAAVLNPCCGHDQQRSYMFPRPLVQNMSIIQTVWQDYILEKEGKAKASVQVIYAFQQSTSTSYSHAYFLFNCKNEVLIAGDNSPQAHERDGRAEWFNLPSTFSGTFSVNPQQRQMALMFEYNQDIGNVLDVSLLNGYWIDITMPVIWVRNSLHPTQRIMSPAPAGSSPSDLLTAMAQPDYAFGKFVPHTCRTQLAEINIKLGMTYMNNDHNQIAYYSGIRIPTSGNQDPKYVFDAIAGNNRHFAYLIGVNFQVDLSRCERNYSACIFLNLEDSFFLWNTQWRTLDLLYNPYVNQLSGLPEITIPASGLLQSGWSRYLLVNKMNGGPNQALPAVNILTQQVKVHPHGMVDLTAGGRFYKGGLEIEVGYNLWAHASERLKLKHCFPEIYGIMGTKDPMNPTFTTTASKSTIQTLAVNDTDANGNLIFVPIRTGDLDMRSAASKGTITHKAYVSIGYGMQGDSFAGFVDIGGWAEYPQHHCGVLPLYGAWAKLGASF